MNFITGNWISRLGLGAVLLSASLSGAATPPAAARPNQTASVKSFGGLPLSFEPNRGQTDPEVQYVARGFGCTFFVMPWGTRLMFLRPDATTEDSPGSLARPARHAAEARVLDFRFVGANPSPVATGLEPLPGHVNYFLGSDPARWQSRVPMHRRVRVAQMYPGVDVVFYGAKQRLEYDLVLAPKADPDQIVIEISGADRVTIAEGGDLVLHVGQEEIHQHKPVLHQTVRGVRREIAGGYRLLSPNRVGFQVGEYDREATLVIDPVVNYATYLGGSGFDKAWDVKIDATGAVYVAGESASSTLPATPGAFRTNYSGGTIAGDAFVAKLAPEGNAVEFLSYLGGKGNDTAVALALDATGSLYLTGFTDSTNFPVLGALQPKIAGKKDNSVGSYPVDAFITKLNASGSALVYSTYLGGSGTDEGLGIALDTSNNVYVAGLADSTDFPVFNAVQSTNCGGEDAIVTAVNATGTALLFSTYLGGTNRDDAVSLALDATGAIHVTGYTSSPNFPVTNAVQSLLNGQSNPLDRSDAFVFKLAPGGSPIAYSTFLGGGESDFGYHVAVDPAGYAYVAGWGASKDFLPTNTLNLVVDTNAAASTVADAFLFKLSPEGALLRTAVFGGDYDDESRSVALDHAGHVYVTGFSASPNVPIVGATQPQNAANQGLNDVFVFALDTNFTALRYSLLLGGSGNDYGYGIDVDAAGNAYLVGRTASGDFPTTSGLQSMFAGGATDAFIARVLMEPLLSWSLSGTNLVLSWPAPAPGFILQTAGTVDLSTWFNVLPTPVLTNGAYTVTVPYNVGSTNFRLYRP